MSDDQDHPRGGDAGTERDLIGEIEALRVDVATLVGRDASTDLRAEVAALRTGMGQVLARLDALTGLDSQPTSHQQLLEDLQDSLADVASGEVVSALWDEVRRLRTDLPDLIVVPEPAAPVTAGPDGRDEQLHEQLGAIRTGIDEVHARLDEGLVLADDPDATSDERDGVADAIAEQVAALRGFVSSELDTVGQTLTARIDAAADAAAAARPVDDGPDEQLLEQLGAIRAGIDEVRARLDEEPAPADHIEPATDGREVADVADIEAIADQVAALRDYLASELDTVRQTVAARLDASAEATATTVAEIAARPEPTPAPATGAAALDPETLEALRDEIRASGAVADQVVDALREELKALRRRIAVKASERVLDDHQLALIADAVAARLAEDREQG